MYIYILAIFSLVSCTHVGMNACIHTDHVYFIPCMQLHAELPKPEVLHPKLLNPHRKANPALLGGSWVVISGVFQPPKMGYNYSYPTSPPGTICS